jgi:2-oxoglutarate dehydrogenase E1 component
MLRRQALRGMRRPLVVMSPKSLLRHPLAVSSMDELANGTFLPAIGEIDDLDPKAVKRVVLCSGKVYYDLLEQRRKKKDVAIVRIEQLYPFPHQAVQEALKPMRTCMILSGARKSRSTRAHGTAASITSVK